MEKKNPERTSSHVDALQGNPDAKKETTSNINCDKIPDDCNSDENIRSRTSSSSSSNSKSYSNDKEESTQEATGRLDILSNEFDPLAALYCKDISMIKNIVPNAPTLDNVEVFAARYNKKCTQNKAVSKGDASSSKKASAKSEENIVVPNRKFTAEQMPVQGRAKEFSNVLKFMKKQGENGGPMAALQNCIDTGRRIKVFIRGIDRMRGYCVGGIVAFDKHWNFAMVDVDEVYERKRIRKAAPIADEKLNLQFKRLECKNDNNKIREHSEKSIEKKIVDRKHECDTKVQSLDSKSSGEPSKSRSKKCQNPQRTEYVGASVMRIEKIKRKTEICRRHIPQLLIRGEHVASVVLL